MKKLEIETLETYKPEWNTRFIEEKNELLKELERKDVRIEHIGSTSVEGMEARPVIDIMIGLTDFDKSIKKVKRILKDHDYREMANQLDLSERSFFIREDDSSVKGFSVLVVKVNGRLWRKKLEKKMTLSSSEEARKDYIEFKRKSIEKSKGDPESYFKLKEEYFAKK